MTHPDTFPLRSVLAAASLFVGLASVVSARVEIRSVGQVYREDFNRAGGWVAGSAPWVNNETVPGWYAAYYNSTNGEFTTPDRIFITDGQANSVSSLRIYRPFDQREDGALGSQAYDAHAPGPGGGGIFYGVGLVNRTSRPITSFTLSYNVELWRVAVQGRQLTLTAAYLAGGDSITDEDEWTLIPGTAYTTPRGSAPGARTAVNVDGNADENRTAFTDLRVDGFRLAPGQTLWIRWFDVNNRGNDHGIAIDDVEIRFGAD